MTTALLELDNQAAILALTNNRHQPSQYLIDEIHTQLAALRRMHHCLHIHVEWVLGHSGIQGNEDADMLARAVTMGATCPTDPLLLPRLLHKALLLSTSALKADHCRTVAPAWKALWQASLWAAHFACYSPELPNH